MPIKQIIKALIPEAVLAKIQSLQSKYRLTKYQNLTPQEIFSDIYNKGLWGKSSDPTQRFYSGSGSHDSSITAIYVDSVHNFLRSLPNRPNVVDLGCGDFSVGSQIRPLCDKYTACDIVPSLIAFNKQKYQSMDVDFRVVDLISDELPVADVAFIRQVLQHLSNHQIEQVIPKLARSFKFLILTEHLPAEPEFAHNLDKPAGPDIRLGIHSGVVVTSPPFNLLPIAERQLCEITEYGGLIRTTLYQLQQ